MTQTSLRKSLAFFNLQVTDLELLIDHLRPAFSAESEDIRAAIEVFVEERSRADKYDAGAMGTLLILIRCVCAAPEHSRLQDSEIHGGWAGVPVTEEEVNESWPVQVDDTGTVRLPYNFRGYYSEPYDATSDFQYLLKRFGRRQNPR